MPFRHRLKWIAGVIIGWVLFSAARPALAGDTVYLPLVSNGFAAAPQPPADKNDTLAYVNYYRALAGVPAVTFDATLNSNCLEGARYIAQTGIMRHDQSGSPAGLACVSQGNIWMGFGSGWEPADTVDSWMGSVGHRLWLIYPTTPTFGYGFYTEASVPRSGAALDVLSTFANDGASYPGWPIRYPAAGQSGVPATAYPVTLSWRYFGSAPALGAASLTTSGGTPLALTSSTNLSANHKGVQLTPTSALPANTQINVSISGTYDGAPFSYSWSFTTGN